MDDPIRTYCRTLSMLPQFTKLSAERALPMREKARTEMHDPKCAWEKTEKCEPGL